jgi:hypothetical protein
MIKLWKLLQHRTALYKGNIPILIYIQTHTHILTYTPFSLSVFVAISDIYSSMSHWNVFTLVYTELRETKLHRSNINEVCSCSVTAVKGWFYLEQISTISEIIKFEVN